MRFLLGANVPVFGWAKPVPINPWYFPRPFLGLLYVGLAGPLANVVLALLAAGVGHLLFALGLLPYWPLLFLSYLGFISVLLALFNLLPIPPLDGSRGLAYFLPPEARRSYLSLERYGLFVLIALLYATPLLRLLGEGAFRIWELIGW